MPKGGVNELVKTPAGRKYLQRLQNRHRKDILQPGDPMFEKVWGSSVRRREELKRKSKEDADAQWEKHQYEKLRKQGVPQMFIKNIKERPWK